MCGIVGMLGPGAAEPATIARMTACLAHRGPDAEGVWSDDRVGISLGHRRLAVLGLGDEGAQPMVSPSGRFVIVYNGELYNHLDLRRELEASKRAPVWRGGSDTETVLAAVEAWGLDGLLPRTVGMFAIALWDREERVLTLARDRMGEKPLSYAWSGRTFVFASQPSALHAIPGFRPAIDRQALAGLLRYAVLPADRGIHEGVRRLPPGTTLRIRPGVSDSAIPEPYWSFEEVARRGLAEPYEGSDQAHVDRLAEAVTASVRGQMLSDVPIGAFLSGGIDSSLVVATMQELSHRPVRTFTIGFEESGFDESGHARAVAEHLGTEHTEVRLSAADAQAIIPSLPHAYDEPFADSSQIPTILVSRLARRDVTVALSGDGGDELFAGYTRYRQAERLSRVPGVVALGAEVGYRALGQPRRVSLARTIRQGEWAIVRRLLSSNPDAEALVIGADAARADADFRDWWDRTEGFGDLTARSMALDTVRYLPDDILHKVDRAAMSVSLETRVPLLDHRIVEMAWRLPPSTRSRDGNGKWILRELLARSVPRALFERPKAGFGIPVGQWLAGPLRPWAEELLAPSVLDADGLLETRRVRAIWDDHASGRWDAGAELWPILMFQSWFHADRRVGAHH